MGGLMIAAVVGAAFAACASSSGTDRMSGDKMMTGEKTMMKGDGMMEKK
jgi:hypothetical protein